MKNIVWIHFVLLFLLLPCTGFGQWNPLPDTALSAPEQHLSERFGESVAISGNVLVVGASQHDEGPINAGGAAYVYRWADGNWQLEQELLLFDAADHDSFGWQVAVQDDVIAVGAPRDDPFGLGYGFDQGSVTIFRYDGFQWNEEAYLTESDLAPFDEFGNEINLGDDGNQLIVGVRRADDFFGRSYIYEYSEDTESWSQPVILLPSDDVPGFVYFGSGVDISGDFAVVGAPGTDMNVSNPDSGAVYVFHRQGNTWTEQAKLEASDWHSLDAFGNSVAFDGQTLVVGTQADDDLGSQSGSVYVFQFDGTTWNETHKLTASDGHPNQNFGRSVALDDTTLAVSTHPTFGLPGSVYMFEFQDNNWNEIEKLTTTDNVDVSFGGPLSIDGNRLVTAAPYYDVPVGNAGITYVFTESVPFIPGDVDGDGSVNLLDVAPFVALLASGEYLAAADVNQDGEVNLLDVSPFVDLLQNP